MLGALLGKILKGEGVGSSCFFVILHFLLLMSQKEDVMTRAPAAKVACEVLLSESHMQRAVVQDGRAPGAII